MIFRTVKNTNYVCLHKGFLSDKNLSFRAKGLLAYCLGRPDNWEFHVSHLQEVSTEGRDAVYAAIKELIREGYIIRKLNRVKGKFERGSYEIYETPQEKPVPENPDAVEPVTENPDTVSPDPANPPLVNNDSLISNDSNKPLTPQSGESANADGRDSSFTSREKGNNPRAKGTNPRALGKNPKSNPEKIAVKTNVLLTTEEIEKLKSQYAPDAVKEMLEILSNYKYSTGRNYKSDYHTLIGWVKDRYFEKKATGQNAKGKLALPGDGKIDGPDAAWRKKKL
jgi:hypothetical protein